MDRYFSVAKPRRAASDDSFKDKNKKFHPYERPKHNPKIDVLLTSLDDSDAQPSSSNVNNLLLNTLANESNPITHSDLYERTDHIISTSTGHQVAEGRVPSSRPGYLALRGQKIALQQKATADSKKDASHILRNTRIHINGFLADTTDIEMKRLITQAGGQVLLTASGATHILTSQGLSGSKTQKLVNSKRPVYVVKPDWVTDSLRAGKRLSERTYTTTTVKSTSSLVNMLADKRTD